MSLEQKSVTPTFKFKTQILTQKLASKALYVILKIADSAIKSGKASKKDRKKVLKKIIKTGTGALAFTTTAHVHTKRLCRELIVKKLSPDQMVIAKNIPMDDKILFGKNLNKKLSEAATMHKLKPCKYSKYLLNIC